MVEHCSSCADTCTSSGRLLTDRLLHTRLQNPRELGNPTVKLSGIAKVGDTPCQASASCEHNMSDTLHDSSCVTG
jgi:hypothetical protein